MCDFGMKEAIEKLVKAIEGNNIRVQPPKLETISPWLNTDGILKINCNEIKINHGKGNIIFNHEGLSFDFGIALEYIKKGIKVCRKGWNGKGMYVQLEKGGDYEFSEINPFLVIKNTSNSFNTWIPSVSDLLAEDWMIYEN